MNLIIILYNASKYLNGVNLLSLLLLNKKTSNELRKKFANKIFNEKNKSISIEKRLKIWYSLLNISKIKKEINYAELKKNINNNVEIKENERGLLETISLDVKRTSFINNEKENRKKLKNILNIIGKLYPKFGYYQGESYIVSFLLQLINKEDNENEVFYYMVGLIKNSEYIDLYKNDLYLLKKYYYIFDRFIYLYYPRISQILIDTKAYPGVLCTSWFLTLFTGNFPIFTYDSLPLSSLAVFDKFILFGYKAILIASITVISYYQNDIYNVDLSQAFDFVVNKMQNADILKNQNNEQFIKIFLEQFNNFDDDLFITLSDIYDYIKKNEDV